MSELSMTETLFGGLLLSVILFFSSRKLGLSTFWAGILSGALPFILYIGYCSKYWPGGDVLTIHFAVFLAGAGVLMAFGGMREKQQGMHWAPKLISGFFVALVMLNAVLLTISSRGLPEQISGLILPNPDKQIVHTAFPGVVPHDRNKSYEPHLQQIEDQRNLGWQLLGMEQLKALKPDHPQKIIFQLLDKDGQPIAKAKVSLDMWRIANSRDDRHYQPVETTAGVYELEIALPDAGRWLAELNIEQGDNRFRKQQQLFIE